MFDTNPVSLKQLLDDVANCRIQLPDFQRGWVWDDVRIRGLLASISRAHPIGAIMTLRSGGDIRFKCRPVEGISNESAVDAAEFLLDGQQRLTSLYQALLRDAPVATSNSRGKPVERWYYINMIDAMNPRHDREAAIISVPESKIIARDFGREIVLDVSSIDKEFENHMMPIVNLLHLMKPTGWLLQYIGYWSQSPIPHPESNVPEFCDRFSQDIVSNFAKHTVPVIRLDQTTTKEAVCKVFEKVNTGGVPLNTFELVTAMFAADGFSLREDWNQRREDLHSKYAVLRGINGEHFLQIIALLASHRKRQQFIAGGGHTEQAPPISCRKTELLNLSSRQYEYWAADVQAGLEDAARFLHGRFIFTQKDVPYSTQIVSLAALYVELKDELATANAAAHLERWFWTGIFSESYGAGAETQLASDLGEVPKYIRGGTVPRLLREANFVADRLISLKTKGSAAYKGLYALQMKSGAADWRTGKSLSLAVWHEDNIDIHHIFPTEWCKTHNVRKDIIDSVINKTPIDARTNRKIGKKSPSIYLTELDRDTRDLNGILMAHWIDPQLLRANQFNEFFVERGQAMFDLIHKAMCKERVDVRETFQMAVAPVERPEPTHENEEEDDDLVGTAAYDNGG